MNPRAVALSFLLACSGRTCGSERAELSEPAPVERPVAFDAAPEAGGLRMVLSDGAPPSEATERVRSVEGEALGEAETTALLARLPPLEDTPGDRVPFAVREGSRPPPRAGATVAAAWPPPEGPEAAEVPASGPLHVLRYAPEGDVPLAPHLSVTFDQPMVAITSQDEAAAHVPVRLSPEPAGQWRWIGTRTVLFEPDPRFPMATEYTVEIPVGTRSATGGALDEAVRWTFRTPPPSLLQATPSGGPTELEPTIGLLFDQAVSAADVLAHVELRGKAPVALRLASSEEIARAREPRAADREEDLRREVWLHPEAALPKAVDFALSIGAGTPSAEGPRVTGSAQGASFYTYRPLEIEEHRCSWGSDPCPVASGWWIRFDNPLDPDAFDPSTIRVEPEADLRISANGPLLIFDGPKRGRTTYTVTLPATLRDRFGQTLGSEQSVSFRVGPAERALYASGDEFMVLDPASPPTLPIYVTNHPTLRLRVYRVGPEHWAPVGRWVREYHYDLTRKTELPGKKIADEVLRIDTGGESADRVVEHVLDLSPYLGERGYGQLLVQIEPTTPPRNRWDRQQIVRWIQATDIGLSAFSDGSALLGWASSLRDGAGLPGVSLEVYPGGPVGETDEGGLALLPHTDDPAGPQVLVARSGDDLALLPQSGGWWSDQASWRRTPPTDQVRWLVFDDRGMYRPGERVSVKGWVRRWVPGSSGDVGSIGADASRVSWRLRGARGHELATGEAELSALGGFDLGLDLPGDADLGTAVLELKLETDALLSAATDRHPIRIQEFRRPEFEVSAQVETSAPHILGEHATVAARASYYAGGGLAGASVSWQATATSSSYVPPNRSEYSFGAWHPWWWGPEAPGGASAPAELEARTDGSGTHYLDVHFRSMDPPRPMAVSLSAIVADVSRQAWTKTTSLLLHPSALYVGLKPQRPFVALGEPLDVDSLVVDIDGEVVAGIATSLAFERMEWAQQGGRWQEVARDAHTCEVVSAQQAAPCSFVPERAGTWRITARVADAHGRPNETQIRLWVGGGDALPSRGVAMEQVLLVPDASSYQPGDVAEIFVSAPFAPADGVLTYRRDGLLHSEAVHLDGATTTLRVPITDAHTPNLIVQLDLAGKAIRTDDRGRPQPDAPERPAFASGALDLPVPPLSRTLAVSVAPAAEALPPGSDTTLTVSVRDAAGAPVRGAEVALVAVDEAVLALSGYSLPDPIALFYARRVSGVHEQHLRGSLLLADPNTAQPAGGDDLDDFWDAEDLRGPVRRAKGKANSNRHRIMLDVDTSHRRDVQDVDMGWRGSIGVDALAELEEPIALRSNFDALALFAPAVTTGDDGRAVVPMSLPDSLTRYRLMAVAVAGDRQFGQGESSLTAREPVAVRPSPPRFLRFGDRAELPIVVQNQTDGALDVSVALRATNATLLDALPSDPQATVPAGRSSAGRRVRVPANDRVEVRFPVAAELAGTARFEAVVASGRDADAQRFELPVWTPATAEAFASYGVLDDGAVVQPVAAPADAWTQFGGLEITTSSTQLAALTDAVLYLNRYPFECHEQLASRLLANAALRDVLTAFESEGLPDAAALAASVDADLERLASRRNPDGGWAFWRRGDPSWPYLTVHVAHALARAESKGYALPPQMRASALHYLRTIESRLPSWYGEHHRRTIEAYALYVRRLLGDPDPARAAALYASRGNEGVEMEALGWLLPLLRDGRRTSEVAAILRYLGNHVAESAAGAHFATSVADGAEHVLLHSDRRVDGVLLEALIEVDPDNDLIPKLVAGLLDHRQQGHWANTQENALVLVAMDRYFEKYESVTPDFVARAWLGDGFVAEHAFQGHTTERSHALVPMGYLTEHQGAVDLLLQKEGAGRMYYRIGLRYAPRSLQLLPADRGFSVERTYEPVDDPTDVQRSADGTWQIRAGARVRVRVTMATPMRRYHVALIDPLPAGLEALNPALAVTGPLPDDPNAAQTRGWWWSRTWYEHDNLRDEQAEAFTSLLWDGVHEYTYLARATTPGQFVAPPPRAEEMYHPETFGRGATERVIVTAP